MFSYSSSTGGTIPALLLATVCAIPSLISKPLSLICKIYLLLHRRCWETLYWTGTVPYREKVGLCLLFTVYWTRCKVRGLLHAPIMPPVGGGGGEGGEGGHWGMVECKEAATADLNRRRCRVTVREMRPIRSIVLYSKMPYV